MYAVQKPTAPWVKTIGEGKKLQFFNGMLHMFDCVDYVRKICA